MAYMHLVYLHLFTVVPCIFIGAFLLFSTKGTPIHKSLGKIYMALMVFTAILALFMPAFVGPTLFSHFGLLHLLSVVVLFSVASALAAIRRGDISSHRKHMIGLYIGGILIAGSFTLMPGRTIHTWIFGG
ncbi:DUF2306 domain-containing protein [Pseudohalioglobus sediminis]|uniref:DUF2306 domain-containing protein n=1 Tax=Pseudohalioglobus sediminis TaxID=2606449 RepID=A0A5B0X526_9GAMM|nr:DUF2306 domain-containing protein [Pseudohalioglobus sediminis]KAA1194342.1 DUF2306 domain-containing protein [Pseudohalioglobus sediminis]